MQRRLVKSLEDLVQHYDGTVRNSSNEVIQFEYGGDGLDPMMMEGKDKPVDFLRVLEHIKAIAPYPDEEPCKSDEIENIADELIDTLVGPSKDFKDELLGFLKSYAQNVDQVYSKFGLNGTEDLFPVEKHLERLTLSQMVEFVDKYVLGL